MLVEIAVLLRLFFVLYLPDHPPAPDTSYRACLELPRAPEPSYQYRAYLERPPPPPAYPPACACLPLSYRAWSARPPARPPACAGLSLLCMCVRALV